MKNTVLYLGMGTLFTHELDAMTNSEWRVLPLTSWLAEEAGMLTFVLIHIPLFAGLIALVASEDKVIRCRGKVGVGIFLVVHAILHSLFSGHPHYEFSSLLSNGLIYGGAVLGALYLFLEFRTRIHN